jgi:cytoskeletal protein CcmA (bactofilin family)
MKVVGDCEADGAVRVEGAVQGNIRAGKSVVIGKNGVVDGDILTQDAVVAGTIRGTIRAESRLELQGTSRIDGEIIAARLQLEEGAVLNGTVQMSDGNGLPSPVTRGEESPESNGSLS